MITFDKKIALRMANLCNEFYYPTPYLRNDGICTWGYCSKDHTIVWRGTDSALDWAFNFDTERVFWITSWYKVHRGFKDFFDAAELSLLKLLNYFTNKELSTIKVTGHSLGGALAQLCGAYIEEKFKKTVDVYTFGSPKVFALGDNSIKHDFRFMHYRFVYAHDLFPGVPWGRGFYHTTQPIWLDKPIVPIWVVPAPIQIIAVKQHFIPNYIKALSEMEQLNV